MTVESPTARKPSCEKKVECSRTLVNALSFDVEEYFHVHAFKDIIEQNSWDTYESRVVESTRRILKLLAAKQTHATFFVLGWVAEREPDLVQEIANGGHEIASHGYAHQAVSQLTRDQYRTDLERANEAIRSACPTAELKGYRAPSFSINASTPWAFEELKQADFLYDSSVSPVSLHDRYGVRDAPRFAHEPIAGLVEAPPSTVKLGRHRVAVAGGGHFRFSPLNVTRWAIRNINREGHPVVSYLHPWEFDPNQPKVRGIGWKSKFRHYVNIEKTERRLESLLDEFSFDRMDRVFATEITQATRQNHEPAEDSAYGSK